MDSRRTPEALALGGYLVMAFDQVGFATRILQGSQAFYRRCGREHKSPTLSTAQSTHAPSLPLTAGTRTGRCWARWWRTSSRPWT